MRSSALLASSLLSAFLGACSGKSAGSTPPEPSGPGCGDGVRTGEESCDGSDLAGADCLAAGYDGGALACADDCTYEVSACTGTGPTCPDGVATGFEDCDGADLAGKDCLSLGYDGGSLTCAADCSFDTAACTGAAPSCGDGVAEGLEECDGADLRGQSCLSLSYEGGTLACDGGCRFVTGACLAPDVLDSGTGCAGVFNPDQLLDYHLSMAAGDWAALKADSTNSVYYTAELACGSDTPIAVGVRRKRSGSVDKPGLKVDTNWSMPLQSFYGLKKLSFENGISEGSGTSSARDLLAEYLGWRIFVRSGALSGRAAFARVFVNGALIGAYVNVEQVDKRFLKDRLGENDGWLYKRSGSAGDGYQTNELQQNPYEAYFCFWEKNGCAMPSSSELAASLPVHLDITQMLYFGAINALIGNTDAPLAKDNNFIFYDQAPGYRYYFPWDLDTTMNQTPALFRGAVSGGTSMYWDALFSNWEGDYDLLLTDLLEGPLTLAAIEAEIDQAVSVAGAALDADPYVDGDAASSAGDLRTWWQARHPQAVSEVDGH